MTVDREGAARVRAKTIGQAIQVELPNGQKSLLGVITIDCPVCGRVVYQVAGHHIPTLLKLLAQWLDDYPDLTRGVVVEETHTRFQGPGNDPALS